VRKALILVTVLALIAVPSFASFIPDPYQIAILGDILQAMHTVNSWLTDIDELLAQTKKHLYDMWPESTLQEIQYVFNEATSIRQQIDSLACGWDFSLRVQTLWKGLFGGLSFCKPQFRLIYGAPTPGWDSDLEEYYDYSASLRTNELHDWIAQADDDEADAMWLIREAEKGRVTEDFSDPYGPGYSQRLSAIAAARVAKQLETNMNIEREEFRMYLERREDARLRKRKEKDLSLIILSFASGREPFSNIPIVTGSGDGQ
jgi:hypothetical protein